MVMISTLAFFVVVKSLRFRAVDKYTEIRYPEVTKTWNTFTRRLKSFKSFALRGRASFQSG